jgi:ATP-dependent DNA ligase
LKKKAERNWNHFMALPINPPYPPMEALSVGKIPSGDSWRYEPKWDGFRCLVFKDRDKVELQSKKGESLSRYFPELVASMERSKAKECVLDGEIVIPAGAGFSFDDLLQRIHPAQSRVNKLSKKTPAKLIVFDLLVSSEGKSLVGLPLEERRTALEEFFTGNLAGDPAFELSPASANIRDAEQWLKITGGTLDGIIAKRSDLPYQSGNRNGMVKIKNLRTADCVVGGFRYASEGHIVGSLLLGLYDDQGLLHHVGFTSGFSREERKALLKKLQPRIKPPGFTGNAPGGPSRWSTERSGDWQPLKPDLVVEVQYDHFTGQRFRHGTKLLRWRPDKDPKTCSLDQVKPSARAMPAQILTSTARPPKKQLRQRQSKAL